MKTDVEVEGGMEREDGGQHVLGVAPADDHASHPSVLPELPGSPQSAVERKAMAAETPQPLSSGVCGDCTRVSPPLVRWPVGQSRLLHSDHRVRRGWSC